MKNDMKILLLGEFSGLHWAIKEGVQELGCEVVLASTGDGWKKIPGADLLLGKGMVDNIFQLLKSRRKLQQYDVVQFISPVTLSNRLGAPFLKYVLGTIRDANARSYLISAGASSYFWNVRGELRYHPYEENRIYDYGGANRKFWWEIPSMIEWEREFSNSVDGIIPVAWEYALGYNGLKNLRNTIPIPINLSRYSYSDNCPQGKLKIFHGVSRYGFKGTRHVAAAFKILNEKYPNDVQCVVADKMPYSEYVAVLNESNIVVDQTYSYSSGINGLMAMAMGKVVLGGAEPESYREFGISSSPLINVLPDAQNIVENIEKLLQEKSRVLEIGWNSRQYVEKWHSHIHVAEAYLREWKQAGSCN